MGEWFLVVFRKEMKSEKAKIGTNQLFTTVLHGSNLEGLKDKNATPRPQ